MKKAQRYGDTGIDVSTLEEIYELTYKYQILKQEQALNELSKLLGYEVGSRSSAPKQKWYSFAKRIARVIRLLGKVVRN